MIKRENFRCLLRHRRQQRNVVKAGHDSSGTRRYHCKACGAHRVLQAKSPAIDPERKELILRAVAVERLGLGADERVFGVDRQTVAKWLEKKLRRSRL